MWQRWNSGTKIFEKSSDNGAIWTPLGLSADVITEGIFHIDRIPNITLAKLPAGIAFVNVENVFTANQIVNNTKAFYVDSISNATMRMYFSTLHLYLRAGVGGSLIFQDSSGVDKLKVNNVGHLSQASGGYLYPGSQSGLSTHQLSYYISSHASYGLFMNIGLFVSGPVYQPNGTFHYGMSTTGTPLPTIGVDGNNWTTLQLNALQLRIMGYVEGGSVPAAGSAGSISVYIDGLGYRRIPFFVP